MFRIKLPSRSVVAKELAKTTENTTFFVINYFPFSHFVVSENILKVT